MKDNINKTTTDNTFSKSPLPLLPPSNEEQQSYDNNSQQQQLIRLAYIEKEIHLFHQKLKTMSKIIKE